MKLSDNQVKKTNNRKNSSRLLACIIVTITSSWGFLQYIIQFFSKFMEYCRKTYLMPKKYKHLLIICPCISTIQVQMINKCLSYNTIVYHLVTCYLNFTTHDLFQLVHLCCVINTFCLSKYEMRHSCLRFLKFEAVLTNLLYNEEQLTKSIFHICHFYSCK